MLAVAAENRPPRKAVIVRAFRGVATTRGTAHVVSRADVMQPNGRGDSARVPDASAYPRGQRASVTTQRQGQGPWIYPGVHYRRCPGPARNGSRREPPERGA